MICELSVKDPAYGAVGNGSTDDTTSINNAINDANAAYTSFGKPTVVTLPPGTYLTGSTITVKAGVRLRGMGGATIKSAAGSAPSPIVTLYGTADCTLEDVTVDANARTNSIAVLVAPNNPDTAQGDRIAVRNVRIINSTNNAIRLTGLLRGVSIERCTFDTNASGIQVYPVAGQVVKDISIRHNRWVNVGTNHLQFVGTASTYGEFADVLIEGNDMRDMQNSGADGPIPAELWGIDGLRIIGNNIVGNAYSTRGLGFSRCRNAVMSGNTIQDQIIYGSELAGNIGFVIANNTFLRCSHGIAATSDCSDGVISNNTFVGTGRTAVDTTVSVVKFDAGQALRISVTGNVFYDWPYVGSCVKFGAAAPAHDCLVADNLFVVTDANTPLKTVELRRAVRCTVRNNTFRIQRNLATGGTTEDDLDDCIHINLDAASSDLIVDGNEFNYSGTVTVTNHACIGHGYAWIAAANPTGLVVRRNRMKGHRAGLRLSWLTAADQIIEDNDDRGGAIASTFNAAAVYKRTFRIMEAAAAPTTGTWVRGDYVRNLSAAVGSPKGWICTVAGTPGTWVSEGNL